MKISIATDFHWAPIGESREDGDFSAEAFREDFLLPNLKKASEKDPLVVNLDSAEGYPASFLKEAFGELVSRKYFTAAQLKKLMKIEATGGYKLYARIIQDYIQEAEADSR